MPVFELLIDLSLALLLIATLVYCWMLNTRIRILQDGKGELARVLRHFDESTRRASESIGSLQATGKRVGEVVQARLERVSQLAEDLHFLIDRAEKAADRLEAGINVSRSTRKVQEEMEHPPALDEETIVRAAVSAVREEVKPPPAAKPPATGTLQAMIEKIANRTASDPALRGSRAAKFPESRARSRVEQELLEIIRADKG